ncbi:Hypothetical predicted protein [Pelobates cultripes]|uniref:Uncharacterized protein n=1 Tax=Pelobates cultripes TaxID=61616 RepID=A0AAD1VQN3_PELCU|nr:Hypothetical predicted protein [Pelobates cultripes]
MLLASPEATSTLLKLENNIKNYKTDLIRFKKDKQEKVTADYKEHRVYKWLSGTSDLPRFARKRRPIRKPRHYTIDKTSGNSSSESEQSSWDRERVISNSQAQSFLEDSNPANPGIRTRHQSKITSSEGGQLRDEDRRDVPSGGRGRPPRQRR